MKNVICKVFVVWGAKQLVCAIAEAFVKDCLLKFLSSRPRVRKAVISLLLLVVQGLLQLILIVQNIIAELES